jgi:membrane-bound serine protease (ClpP class)
MEVFVVIALVAFALLLAELLLPTGGALAALGAIGLIASGVIALGSDSDAGDYAGAGLITLGILSAVTFYFVAGRVLAAHRNRSVQTGTEELIGATAEARSTIDPEGQVWLQGAIWGARLANSGNPVGLGDRVVVEEVDGLTLVVHPQPPSTKPSRGEDS